MNEILHTLQKLSSYVYINSYQSLKKYVLHFHLIGKMMIFPSRLTRVNPHVDNSHQVWSWYDNPLPSYSVLSAHTSRDLVILIFDLLTLTSCHTWRITWSTFPPSLMTPRLSVMSYNVSRWLPLKMHTQPLRMRRITWPVSRSAKTITFLEPRPRFTYSLCNFYWATTTIKGPLLSSRPMLKPFSGETI